MNLGDIVEIAAAACLVAAAALGLHALWAGLLVAGVCLAYFAQVTDAPIPRPRLRVRRRKR